MIVRKQVVSPGYAVAQSQSTGNFTVTQGNLLIVFGYWFGDATVFTATVKGSLNGAFTQVSAQLGFSPTLPKAGVAQWFYHTNCTGGTENVTITMSADNPPNDAVGLFVFEYSGVDISNPISGHNEALTQATSAMNSGNFNALNGDFILGGFINPDGSGSMTEGAGFVQRVNDTGWYTMAEDRGPVAAGTYAATGTDHQVDSQVCMGVAINAANEITDSIGFVSMDY